MKKSPSDRPPEEDKPYESIKDWYQDIRHLKWPLIIFLILVLILIILLDM